MFSSLVVIHIHIPIRLTMKLLKHNVSCVCERERKRTYGSLRACDGPTRCPTWWGPHFEERGRNFTIACRAFGPNRRKPLGVARLSISATVSSRLEVQLTDSCVCVCVCVCMRTRAWASSGRLFTHSLRAVRCKQEKVVSRKHGLYSSMHACKPGMLIRPLTTRPRPNLIQLDENARWHKHETSWSLYSSSQHSQYSYA